MSTSNIHPSTIISSKSIVGDGTIIGPYCHIDDGVKIGNNCKIDSYVRIQGNVSIGDNTYIGSFSCLGSLPAIYGKNYFDGILIIGSGCQILNNVTVCSGYYDLTTIGDDVLLMSTTHIGHDCNISNGVIIATSSSLGGHCEIGSNTFISGHIAIHQHSKIGRLAFITGGLNVADDIPPFSISSGIRRSKIATLNVVGLKRFGIEKQDILALHQALWLIYSKKDGKIQYTNFSKIREKYKNNSYVLELVDFFDKCKHKRPLSLALKSGSDKF